MDYSSVFRNELSVWIREFLLSENSQNGTLLNPELVKQVVDDHQNKKADNANKIGLLLTCEQIYQFIKNG